MQAPEPTTADDTQNVTPRSDFRWESVSRTDVGMRRAMNQDACAVVPREDVPEDASEDSGVLCESSSNQSRLLVVADGMGAHAAGELASKIAVETLPLAFCHHKELPAPDALREAIREANAQIFAKGSSSREYEGMGTTCSCLVLSGGMAIVGHVGDSRVYRLRKGVLEQLTFDHSLVWEMAAASNVTEDQVPAYIPKNVITRSLGPHETVQIDLEGPYCVEPEDVYLLCSDGLTGVVDDPTIGSLLGVLSPKEAADALVDLANLGGGPDNITVVVAYAKPLEKGRLKKGGTKKGKLKKSNSLASKNLPNSSSSKKPPVAVWALTGFLFVVCCCLMVLQYQVAAFVASLAALVVYCSTLIKRKQAPPSLDVTCMSSIGVHGNGPYRAFDCTDLAPTAASLQDLVHELAQVPSESVTDHQPLRRARQDSESFATQAAAADALLESKNYAEAIRSYAELIGGQMHSAKE